MQALSSPPVPTHAFYSISAEIKGYELMDEDATAATGAVGAEADGASDDDEYDN